MPIIQCPLCRTKLDIPSEWMGTSIRCGGCESEFVATPPAAKARRPADEDDEFDRPRRRPRPADPDDEPRGRRWEDEEDDAPPRRRRRDPDDDDRPRRRRRRKSGGGVKAVVIVLAVVGLLVVGLCGGGGYWVYSIVREPVRFDPAAWKEQALPDGSCSVQLPVTPRTETIPSPGNGVTGTKMLWEAAGGKDAVFVFGWVDAPPVLGGGGFETVYQSERDEVVRSVGGRVVRETPMTVQGYQAKEFEFAAGGATGVYRMVFIPGRTKHRVVLLMAGGRNMTPADRTKFIESFRVKVRI